MPERTEGLQGLTAWDGDGTKVNGVSELESRTCRGPRSSSGAVFWRPAFRSARSAFRQSHHRALSSRLRTNLSGGSGRGGRRKRRARPCRASGPGLGGELPGMLPLPLGDCPGGRARSPPAEAGRAPEPRRAKANFIATRSSAPQQVLDLITEVLRYPGECKRVRE